MKVYLTSTPEFSKEVLTEVVLILNQTPGELEFILGSPLTVTQFGLVHTKMNTIEKIDFLTFDELFNLCETYRKLSEDREHNFVILEDDFVVLVTSIKNYKNWFSAFKGKNIFIDGVDWEYYTKRDAKFGIAYQVLENIFQSQIELNIDDVDNEPNIHMESIGCINDMCLKKTDVMLKLRTADICESCINRAEEKQVNPLILDHISRIIRNTREAFVNSYRIESKVKPENVYIDPARSVTIGNKNIKLDAIYKVLFIFFLKNLEGVETKLIFNYEEDLYNIYKEVRDNPNKKTITKMVSIENNNLETYRTRLNQALVNQLGPKLAEFYILDRVEIKDDYNRYKINLADGYISIDPPKRK
jgi:hypothetical protein